MSLKLNGDALLRLGLDIDHPHHHFHISAFHSLSHQKQPYIFVQRRRKTETARFTLRVTEVILTLSSSFSLPICTFRIGRKERRNRNQSIFVSLRRFRKKQPVIPLMPPWTHQSFLSEEKHQLMFVTLK